jgi:polar amino acid transport system substrate-binding protein
LDKDVTTVNMLLRLFSSLLVLLCLIVLPAVLVVELQAQDSPDPQAITVVTKDIEPFVFVDGEEVSGFSIDLWKALALELGIPYTFEIVATVQEQLDAVESNEADLAMAAISITAEREKSVDFSHRYFESGLGILTRSGNSTPLLDSFRLALSPTLLRLFVFLVLSILIAGHIIWIIERRRNEEFPQTYLRGVSEGIWWAAVTVTTVGYGDRTPVGRLGRMFGILWMFAGLFIIANFTAGVTSQLTLQTLQGEINGPEDLPGKRIATVAGSTSDTWLESEGIGYRTTATIEEAYSLLDSGSVEAIVYDHPVLLYYALQNEEKNLVIPGEAFNKEDYGIAFPTGSPLREEVNRALLILVENGTYQQIVKKWYGSVAGQ